MFKVDEKNSNGTTDALKIEATLTLRASWAEGSESQSCIEIKAAGDVDWCLQQAQRWVDLHSGGPDRKPASIPAFPANRRGGKSKESNGADATA